MKNEKALMAFMTKIAEAKTLLDELQNYVDDHMEVSPDDVHWGHVGDAERLLQNVTAITDWVFNRGECAE